MPAMRKPVLEDVRLYKRDLCEVTPFIWEDRLHILECIRPGSGGSREDYYLIVRDAETGEEVARFAEGYGLASAYVHEGEVLVTASRYADNNWNDVTLFRSRDLKAWNEQVIITQEEEHLFNSSLCHGPDGFVLAYESNDPRYPAFTTKFAVSADLETWEKRPDATFGLDRYTACPDIHYVDGHYYVLYLERQPPRHYFETYVTRSRDLIHWERSGANPVLAPSMLDDGINASDPALVEVDGETRVYYAVGDQRTWMNIKQGTYPGSVKEFLTGFYARPGVPDPGTKAAREDLSALPPDTTWFQDAKFGIFVHWGLYALHGRNDTRDYASWAMHDDKIPVSEYAPYADQFDPKRFDAKAWMELVREAGARYMTFTSKHHEGFSLFDSALTNYDTADRAAGRDIVGELVTAARAQDVRIGFYYSMLDWYHPDFEKDLGKYVDEFLFGQVRELCMNYGPIDGIWFDGEWDHPESTWRAAELVAMIHRLQPDALVNDRLGKGVRGETVLADFYTREQMSEIGKVVDGEGTRVRPWEACLTIGRSWGYRVDDGTPKSSAELIRTLVDVVSRGGNLLLNVGPTPDGEIPEPLARRLRAIGDWLARNGEGIYGTRAVRGITASAGKLTGKWDRVYVHLEEHPGAALQLTGLPASPKEAWVVSTGERLRVDGETGSVALPEMLPEGAVTSIGVAW
jgi:alpha-L-fucosidase